MHNKFLIILVGAILLPSMALFVRPEPTETDPNEGWGDLIDPQICQEAVERLPTELGEMHGTDCVKIRGHRLLMTTVDLPVMDENLPVRVVIAEGSAPIRKVIVEIVGGPGEALLLRPGIESWADGGRQTVEQCNGAVLSPAYSGTWHRSSYPHPSERRAALEVDALLAAAGKSLTVSIVAQSLGARIVSRPEVRIPSGNHLFFVPMLVSPHQYTAWLEGGTRRDQILRRAAVTNFVIGPEGQRTPQRVPTVEFNRAFFERSDDTLMATLPELWARKGELDSDANVSVVIATKEERAGGIDFAPRLREIGWSVSSVKGLHFPSSSEERKERARLAGRFLRTICGSDI